MKLLNLKEYAEGAYILMIVGFEEDVMRFKTQFEKEHIRTFKTYCTPEQEYRTTDDIIDHLVSTGIDGANIYTNIIKSSTDTRDEIELTFTYKATGPSYSNFNPNPNINPIDFMSGNGLECDIPLESTVSKMTTHKYFNKNRQGVFGDTVLTYVYEVFEEGYFTDHFNMILEMSRQYPELELSLDMIDPKDRTVLFRVCKNGSYTSSGPATTINYFKKMVTEYNLTIFLEECPYCRELIFLEDINNSDIEDIKGYSTHHEVCMFNHTGMGDNCCGRKIVVTKEGDHIYLEKESYLS